MAKQRNPRGLQRSSAGAEKTKASQLVVTARPFKFIDKLLPTVESFEQLLKLAIRISKIYRLVIEAIDQIKDIFL
ncbi:hypothetical protein [Aeromonas media]|uniref:hypothetical protein n=1 Tax=Aeromonas media TaxID=651 RepID=UPI003D1C8641